MKKQTAEVEALTSKLADMETLVSSKDGEIRDMKKFVEGLKGTFSGKIQGVGGGDEIGSDYKPQFSDISAHGLS
ncbi:hypothetical protein P5673_010325, partial [Acropora cervicornis]